MFLLLSQQLVAVVAVAAVAAAVVEEEEISDSGVEEKPVTPKKGSGLGLGLRVTLTNFISAVLRTASYSYPLSFGV